MEKQDFGKKLIEVRKAKGLTQEEVAEKCNITVRTVQRIESGVVEPRAYTIKTISEVLGFDFFETSEAEVNKEKDGTVAKKRSCLWYVKDLFNLKTNAMKKVSILTTFFLTIGVSLFLVISDTQAQSVTSAKTETKGAKPANCSHYVVTKDRIQVQFSNELTIDSLVYFKDDLKKKGISLNYQKVEFDSNNKLIFISCEMVSNDGFSGSFTASLLDIKNCRRPGFYRDYRKNAESPFGSGNF